MQDNGQKDTDLSSEAKAMLADLEGKLAAIRLEEQAIIRRHEKELSSIASRLSLVEATVQGIKTLYMGSAATPQHRIIVLPEPSFIVKNHHMFFGGGDLLSHPQESLTESTAHNPHPKSTKDIIIDIAKRRRRRGVLRDLVLLAITDRDTFLTTDEVADFIATHHPEAPVERKEISTGLKDYRRSNRVVAFPAYDSSGNRHFLNGLPEFYLDFSNPEFPEVKPEYISKLRESARRLALTFNKPQEFIVDPDELDEADTD
jgi:hypothetical protein